MVSVGSNSEIRVRRNYSFIVCMEDGGTSLVPINSIARYSAVAVGIYWYQDFGGKKGQQDASDSATTKLTIFFFFGIDRC